MSVWLSDEWFERARSLASDLPERPGLTARIQLLMTGGPEGDVSCYWALEDGRPTSAAAGALDVSDVTLTLPWSDAAAIQAGALDPGVAFMQGRMKATGSMAVVLDLLSAARGPECQGLRRQVVEFTEF